MVDMVTVCCRLTHGLELRLAPAGDAVRRAQLSENKTPDRTPVRAVKSVTVNGANRAPGFHPKDNRLLGMVGRTQVEKSFWDAWVAQHADSDLVKNHCVFAEVTERRADDRCREYEQVKTGFEPLDPEELKRKGLADAEEAARARTRMAA